MRATAAAYLADISLAQFRQYKISITCTDHEAPRTDRHLAGPDITIACIPGLGVPDRRTRMTILAKVTAGTPSRDEWAAEMAWQLEAEQRTL